jgi:hypothetical protein
MASSRVTRPARRRRPCAILIAFLASLAFVAVCFAGTAGADSRGFRVNNLTGHDARVASAVLFRNDHWEGRPDDAAVLRPGADAQVWELSGSQAVNDYSRGVATYELDGTRVTLTFTVPNVLFFRAPYASCESGDARVTCAVHGTTITLLDPPGTVHEISADRPRAQAALIKQWCSGGIEFAACEFHPTNQVRINSPLHKVGEPFRNSTIAEQRYVVKVTDTVGSSDSLGGEITASGTIAKIVKLAVTVNYEHEWTEEHTFEEELDLICPPRTLCWVNVVTPLLRTTGEFVLMVGNTKWVMPGIYVDTPDTDRVGSYQACDEKTCVTSLTPAPGSPFGRVESGRYVAPTTRADRQIAEPRIRLSATAPSALAPGQAADYQVTMTAAQPAGRLVYPLQHIDLLDTVSGSVVASQTVSGLAPGEVRTVPLQIVVPPEAHGALCTVISATAPHARDDSVRVCAHVTG